MKILITAGGTTEKIDSVRCITNVSTGKLGSLVAEAFSGIPDTEVIYYVCSKTAIVPQSDKLKILHVDSVASLEATVRELLEHTTVDIIVHSMAVSDYRVKLVTSASMLSASVLSCQTSLKSINKQNAESLVTKILENSETVINDEGKISSNVDNMVLLMERTPKIISLYQSLSPQSTLVGFKLLDHVPLPTLIDKGFQVLNENKCSFVLANDLKDIAGEQHRGYLIDKNKNYIQYETKPDIANAIVAAAMKERGK